MASISFPPSIGSASSPHLIGRKMAVDTSPLPPRSIRFQPLRISAAERVASSYIASPKSLYEVLGIHMNATCQEIKVAYRRLARVSHPDVALKDTSADEFIKIHSAYATLSDPAKRADYDRTLLLRQRPVSSRFGISAMAGSPDLGFSGNTRRKWETDQCW